MNAGEIKASCHSIAEHYGYESQSAQLTEECAELIQALSKYRRARDSMMLQRAHANIIEEMADVEIMLEQIKYLLKITEYQIAGVKQRKIERTLDRIDSTSWQVVAQ